MKRPQDSKDPPLVGPAHRQVDDAPVRPTPEARTIRVRVARRELHEAREALSEIGYVTDAEGDPGTLELTVDGNGLRRVEQIVSRLGGRVTIGS